MQSEYERFKIKPHGRAYLWECKNLTSKIVAKVYSRVLKILLNSLCLCWVLLFSLLLVVYFSLVSSPGGGGTCENFDRDARVIFLGLKFTKMSFFGFR